MRTSLVELQQLEEHIFNGNDITNDHETADKVHWQKETYALVHQYGRQKMKAELETIHHTLFTDTRYARFRRHIMRLFL